VAPTPQRAPEARGGTAVPSERRERGPGGRRRAGRLASGPAIRDAALALFLERGYLGTSMDDVAAAARVSKQTIYTHFTDKETLFAELVLGNAERVEQFVSRMRQVVHEADDPVRALHDLARLYVQFVIRPQVVLLRRLVLAEAGRFPDLAHEYYQRVPERVYLALAELLEELAAQGTLRMEDAYLAAHHFAWLVLGMPLDRAMFDGGEATGPTSLDEVADAGVRVFLAAYAGD
jgi:TetR/AcrR family transcriptional regulator, mexJK operon transcriptional repressor